MDNAPILNKEQIDDLRGLDGGCGAVLARLVGRFLSGLDDRANQIVQCATESRPSDLAIVAHSLKGAAGNLGALRLAAVASKLEVAANGNDADQIQTLLVALRSECETARVALTEIVGNSA